MPLSFSVDFLSRMSRGEYGEGLMVLISGIGAPIDVTPLKDDPKLGADASRNDNFRFDPQSQERCPFAAHIRKTNPRADLGNTESHRILRQGIPFGPEVSAREKQQKKTESARGLLFVCYQSSIGNGFEFIQRGKHLFFFHVKFRPIIKLIFFSFC